MGLDALTLPSTLGQDRRSCASILRGTSGAPVPCPTETYHASSKTPHAPTRPPLWARGRNPVGRHWTVVTRDPGFSGSGPPFPWWVGRTSLPRRRSPPRIIPRSRHGGTTTAHRRCAVGPPTWPHNPRPRSPTSRPGSPDDSPGTPLLPRRWPHNPRPRSRTSCPGSPGPSPDKPPGTPLPRPWVRSPPCTPPCDRNLSSIWVTPVPPATQCIPQRGKTLGPPVRRPCDLRVPADRPDGGGVAAGHGPDVPPRFGDLNGSAPRPSHVDAGDEWTHASAAERSVGERRSHGVVRPLTRPPTTGIHHHGTRIDHRDHAVGPRV